MHHRLPARPWLHPPPPVSHVVVLACRPAPTAEEDELLRESLLSGGADVEAGQAASGTKKRQHSWISLVGIAAQYMWPDEFMLQVTVRWWWFG